MSSMLLLSLNILASSHLCDLDNKTLTQKVPGSDAGLSRVGAMTSAGSPEMPPAPPWGLQSMPPGDVPGFILNFPSGFVTLTSSHSDPYLRGTITEPV